MKKTILIITTLLLVSSLFSFSATLASPNQEILITEIGNHEPSELQWIEIYNQSDQDFDLTSLIFREDAVNHRTTLMQGSNILPPDHYALIVNKYDLFITKYHDDLPPNITILDSSWKTLSKDGELLELIKNSVVYDSITYSPNSTSTSLERLNSPNGYLLEWLPHPIAHSAAQINFHSSTTQPTEEDQPATIVIPSPVPTEPPPEPDPPIKPEPEPEQAPTDPLTPAPENENENENEKKNDDDSTPLSCPANEPIYITHYIEKPYILISEFSFNSSPDWIEIYLDPRNNEIDLNDIKLEIDNKFLSLGLHGKVSTPSFIVAETPLVATTEQVSVVYQGKIYDSICYTNGNPPLSEQIEEELLKAQNHWIGNCLDSTQIKKDETFFRPTLLPDTNQAQDFKKTNQPTKGSSNQITPKTPNAKINIKNGKTNAQIPFTLTLDGSKSDDPNNQPLNYLWNIAGQTSKQATTETLKFETAGQYPITLTVTNPDGHQSQASLLVIAETKPTTNSTSSSTTSNTNNNLNVALTSDQTNTQLTPPKNIQLKSFLPNPKGLDTNNEYIEIINLDTVTVPLKNYYLDDEIGGSKPFHLENYILQPQETLKLFDSETKIILGNTKDSVRLLYFDQLLEEIAYEQAKDDELFTKTNGQWERKIGTASTTASNTTETSNTSALNITPLVSNLTAANKNSANPQGTLNDQLKINEVFPNPKGPDPGNEWLEIYNPNSINTSLNGWTLKINKKEHKLDNKTINHNAFLLIKDPKISLPNSNTTIQLIDFNKKVIDEISYEKSVEDHSYIPFHTGYIWTPLLTPQNTNPQNSIVTGQINQINPDIQLLTLETSQKRSVNIFYKQNLQNKLQLEDTVELSVFATDNKVYLHEILKIEKPKPTPTPQSRKILYTILIPLIGITTYLARHHLRALYDKATK